MRRLTPSSASCVPKRLTTPSTSTENVSVATRRLRAHAAQPDVGELERDLVACRNVDGCQADDRTGEQMEHHAADQALKGDHRMHPSETACRHLCRHVAGERG